MIAAAPAARTSNPTAIEDAPAHATPAAVLVRRLETDASRGLDESEAAARLARHGPNALPEQPGRSLVARIADQLRGFLILILLGAALVSFAIGERLDAVAILAIVALNAAIGVAQEWRAERALAALGRLAAPGAVVVRSGAQRALAARELVPGDVVLLEAGNFVPADVRLIETARLELDESALTGESTTVAKDAGQLAPADAPLAERISVAHMGTLVTAGRGRGVVVGTGARTEIGRIAALLARSDEKETPLQRTLDALGRRLGLGSVVACAVIFALGALRETNLALAVSAGPGAYAAAYQAQLAELFMAAVSLAVAAVPEGLPAVVTVSLALGVQRMARRHALVRRLPAVETLGSATVICSDKTGTLTENAMTVARLWTAAGALDMSGAGYEPRGGLRRDGVEVAESPASVRLLLGAAAACSDARLARDAAGVWRVMGDPTEAALVVAAAKVGLRTDALVAALPRVAELPFDSSRKRMTTLHRVASGEDGGPAADWARVLKGTGWVAFTKGAPDGVIERCTALQHDSERGTLDGAGRRALLARVDSMARAGLRVLAIAHRPVHGLPDDENEVEEALSERDLVLLGLVGIHDPARPEVREAVERARAAGIRTVMITGDHRDTALAVGRAVSIAGAPGDRDGVLTGVDLDRLLHPGPTDPDKDTERTELEARVDHVHIYARVSPEHKVEIVRALQARGHVVAMTGDGVNDAPALARADIGVAMGRSGTDVAREAADLVLLDDNYATLVAAVEEGRTIFANIRRFVAYLISCNLGEILAILLTTLAGLPLPLRPLQLLWLNLVTDGAPAVALGLEPAGARVMGLPPRGRGESIIPRRLAVEVAAQAVATGGAVFAAFALTLRRDPANLALAQTAAFTTLVVSELLRAFTARSQMRLLYQLPPLGNPWLVAGTLSSAVLLAASLYVPALQPVFGTVPLGAGEWLRLLPFMLAAPLAAELLKLTRRRRAPG
ncbi:MAG TPA: cation-transporting P-type ATPase [Chloroflexota bacterium]|nr:cation-transporting P-type ATPase [Chloroflexota bacterium]